MIVVGFDLCGALEQLRGALEFALREAGPPVEVMGFERVRIKSDGLLKFLVGLSVPL